MIFNFIKEIDNDLLHRVFASENYQTTFGCVFISKMSLLNRL